MEQLAEKQAKGKTLKHPICQLLAYTLLYCQVKLNELVHSSIGCNELSKVENRKQNLYQQTSSF